MEGARLQFADSRLQKLKTLIIKCPICPCGRNRVEKKEITSARLKRREHRLDCTNIPTTNDQRPPGPGNNDLSVNSNRSRRIVFQHLFHSHPPVRENEILVLSQGRGGTLRYPDDDGIRSSRHVNQERVGI